MLRAARMAKAFRSGLTDRFTKVTGKTTKQTDVVVLFMRTVTFTTVSGKTIRHMASVFTTTPMALATKATGSRTSSMDRAKKYGQIARVMRVNTRKVRSTAKGSSCGLTVRHIQVTFLTTTSKAKEFTRGLIKDSTAVNG